jgi:hypothetical protein
MTLRQFTALMAFPHTRYGLERDCVAMLGALHPSAATATVRRQAEDSSEALHFGVWMFCDVTER